MEWFETLLSVQRSAVGSTEFYLETSRALVELVGLDRGLVLLHKGEKWRLAAGHNADPRRGLRYSVTIVDMVAEQGRTFYGNPQGLTLRTSLANVEALVASPVLDETGAVVGILYGSRDVTPARPLAEIQPLEAQVVQMLASSVSVGLIRLACRNNCGRSNNLPPWARPLDSSFTTCAARWETHRCCSRCSVAKRFQRSARATTGAHRNLAGYLPRVAGR